MKKIMKYFSLLLLVMSMQACNSLDQLPVNQLTDDVFWSSLDRANMLLNMGYSQMYSVDKIWQDEALSDNLIEARGGSDVTYIRRGQANSSTGLFQSEWKWCFEGIKTANVFIDHVDFIPDAEPEVKASMVAQARFIRAYLYFRLSNFYGDIPFFLGDITMAESKAMTRAARATVLAALHQELDEIIPQLPKKEELSAAERGRITKAAAVMLNARVYLMQGDMDNVKKYCGYLIDNQDEYGRYSLFTTATASYSAYENLFMSAYEYNDEVILDYTRVPLTKTWNNFIDMVPQSVPYKRVVGRAPTQSLVESYITTSGLPVSSANTKPTPYATDPAYNENSPYANRDPRLAATVIYDGATWKDKDANGAYTESIINIKSGMDAYGAENATQSGYYVRKLFDPDHETDLKMSNNIIMMRYADVLLMYAEACERTNTFTNEVWDNTIRPIRARAGFTSAGALDFPGLTNLREIIRRERRCELACEGLRYYDLIRWDGLEAAGNLLNGVVYGAKLTPQSDYIKVETYSYTPGRDEWWSLPQHDIDQIPTLRPNNPNY
ncbi:MAG: RagB/SusD family nutrient uptake outer membrane protein [Prevotellaceae bacterium]|jgi:hypothetical protein|nr:RagB/SusD family nutrient uptake outer membrane protein [Prevotellaceae bacterium]